jgi:CBS domain-containing membrane protein
MVLLRISHPPAGATTLIISLGIISKPRELVIIEVAVFHLVAQALVINRLAGLPYPFWTGTASAKPADDHLE